MDAASITAFLETWGYPAFYALLSITAFGFPIPEDFLLLAGGYLISARVFSWPAGLAIAVAGVVTSDLLLYTIGRRMRSHALDAKPGRFVPIQRLHRFASWFDRVGAAAVFLARLVPGTRAVVFISAGLRGVRVWTFLAYDIPGALIWTPAVVWAGTAVGEQIGDLAALIEAVERLAFWVIVAVVLLLAAWRLWRTEESKL